MEHQFLHLIIAPLVLHPKCELTPNEHSMYLRFLWFHATTCFSFPSRKSVDWVHSGVSLHFGGRRFALAEGKESVNRRSGNCAGQFFKLWIIRQEMNSTTHFQGRATTLSRTTLSITTISIKLK